jgi:hypothetical protein
VVPRTSTSAKKQAATRLRQAGTNRRVARFEGVGPLTLNQVRRFLTDTSCQITVQPVIDPQDVPPVDGYEIPRRIREAMFLRMPASCFPYATKPNGWTWTTPSHTYRWPAAAHPAKPGSTTSAR